jgi:hypothetical protein
MTVYFLDSHFASMPLYLTLSLFVVTRDGREKKKKEEYEVENIRSSY